MAGEWKKWRGSWKAASGVDERAGHLEQKLNAAYVSVANCPMKGRGSCLRHSILLMFRLRKEERDED